MKRFILELRRREVFRTAGLYVGVCWILIEVSSVLLPTFDAPEWVLKGIIIASVIGFPVTLVLAWVYDVTARGIEVQGEHTDTIIPPIGSRRMDYIVIGVLSVALVISVYLNVTGGPEVIEELEPVSVLIADFKNETGQELFDGLVEQALNIGIESAPHVTSYQRNGARELAGQLKPGNETLDAAAASLVAVRQGIKMVLSGSIVTDGNGYELTVEGVDPMDGRTLFSIGRDAKSADSILQVVGDLSKDVRAELGDTTLSSAESAIAETFTAASIEAARAYMNGIELAYKGDHEAAVDAYREALAMDPNLGRAYSGLALSLSRIDEMEASEEAWKKAFETMDSMTERERLRTQGVYYASVTQNFSSAIDAFRTLIERYPADAAAYNNLAVVSFFVLDFDSAREYGGRLLEIYPTSTLYRSNYALFAMYAGDFATAAEEGARVIELDSSFYKGFLSQAVPAMDAQNWDGAEGHYKQMAESGERGASLAMIGLADLAAFRGDYSTAATLAAEGRDQDLDRDNSRSAARKQLLLAELAVQQGDDATAIELADAAWKLHPGDAVKVPAALVFVAAGATEEATAIAEELTGQLQPQRRALGQLIEAAIDRQEGRYVDAVDKLTQAGERADLWLVRLQRGIAYLDAGYAAEALAEFEAAVARRGEGYAVFLDDVPTARYLAELPYWKGRAELELGMTESARTQLQQYIDNHPQGGRYVADATARL